MIKIIVSVMSFVALAAAGGTPYSYSTLTPGGSATFSSGVAVAAGPVLRSAPAIGYSAGYAAAPAFAGYSAGYAAPAVAAPALASYSGGPVLRSAPAFAGYSAGYAAAPAFASYSAAPVLRSAPAFAGYSAGYAAAPAFASYSAAPVLRSAPAFAGYSAGYAAAPAVASYTSGPALVRSAAPALVRSVAPAFASYAAAPALVRSAPVAFAQPAAVVKTIAPEPYDAHPQYNYGYSVQDGLTGDQKSASESRDGDLVQGQYSLVEPDGAIRTVTYTADAVNGFNAVVDRQAPQIAVKQIAVAAAPVAVGYKTAARLL